VIGDPVEHSLSPALHRAAFAAAGIDAEFVRLRVVPRDLSAAIAVLRARGPIGVSVTVPHKIAVAALCDRVSPVARSIGAVNCLSFAGAEIVGHNTDAPGFRRAVRELAGVDTEGARVVLLGGGGAARAVAAGLPDASSVTVVARSPERVRWTRARPWNESTLEVLMTTADLVVDATSAGLSAAAEARMPPVPLAALPHSAVVTSLVYHRRTELLRRAADRGLRTLGGAGMLLYQGVLAFELWTGTSAPTDSMRAALEIALRD